MMERYSLIYIDDKPDEALTRYLDRELSNEDYQIDFSEIVFHPEEGYESLLTPTIKGANIIIIDSLLFENKTATGGKFTGEEFKLFLKKYCPFIEVIVITQNGDELGINKVSKYNKTSIQTAAQYYASIIPKQINEAIGNIQQYRRLASIFSKNDIWETMIKEKVIDALNGINPYEDLTKEDIDNLIAAFKEVQESLDE